MVLMIGLVTLVSVTVTVTGWLDTTVTVDMLAGMLDSSVEVTA